MQYKGVLEEILANLRCIDVTGNEQVDSYVDDSIRIIKEYLEKNKDTAQEVPVQEQSGINFSPQTGKKLNENCPICWVKNKPFKCGFDKCPGHKLLVIEATTKEK